MKKKRKRRSLEIGVCCKTIQEHYDMLGIICYLQEHYRRLKLFKKKTWFKNNAPLHNWAENAIKRYKTLQTRPFDDEKNVNKGG